MKKILIILLSVAVLLSLASCEKSSENPTTAGGETTQAQVATLASTGDLFGGELEKISEAEYKFTYEQEFGADHKYDAQSAFSVLQEVFAFAQTENPDLTEEQGIVLEIFDSSGKKIASNKDSSEWKKIELI